MASESIARCRALAKRLAEELGLPFVEQQIPAAAAISFNLAPNGRAVGVLSAGYFERLEGGPNVVAARLNDIIEGVVTAKSMIRLGRFEVQDNGTGGYRVAPRPGVYEGSWRAGKVTA